MVSLAASRLAALSAALSLVGCFSFETNEGLSCSETGACPDDQVCSDGICLRPGSVLVDPVEPAIDASPAADAEAEGCASGTLLCGELCLAECETTLTVPGQSTYQPDEGCTTLRVLAWGAGGGHGAGNLRGGGGGFASVELPVSTDDQFIVVVGAPGQSAVNGSGGLGGLPGGGKGGSGGSQGGGGGGGFSGLFRNTIDAAGALVIAGGGGGSGGGGGNPNNTLAGAGGGLDGQSGRIEGTPNPGGSQSTGFAPLVGGDGGNDSDGGGGGGAGWFGGRAGSGANSDAQGAGGGSGYVGDAPVSELLAGDRTIAGNPDSPLRGTAGDPTLPGKIVLSCLP